MKKTNRFYKPNEFGILLEIPPTKVTKLAKDIDERGIYSFEKTTLGSYLFRKEDFRIMKDYHDLLRLLHDKEAALEKLEEKIVTVYMRHVEKRPPWFPYIVSKKKELR